ncbi:CehA/McbA family metallohydrolase [Radiobacillus kanasensis]|uniref:CehA/McbA family metallohydrolase n=1 Tax=Radiobacillus kanasensis TaxID=2844358 RepID=UPI001E43C19D|nr:CehA/McbA family metallohydrolase [Radiobacillus kanasensis]UFT99043.1 CehA/McbA family metallohydrolase [Radiobacillus kanasensis]
MKTLLETRVEVTQESMQSHISYKFYVPENVEDIVIDFSFHPSHLQDAELAAQIAEQSLRYYGLEDEDRIEEQVNEYLPIKNLLTLSIDDPDGFRGARHSHLSTQKMTIGEKNSSPGVLNKMNQSGLWIFTISVHAIVSETCSMSLKVSATGIEQHVQKLVSIPWQKRPLKRKFPFKIRENEPFDSKHRTDCRWVPSELHSHTYHSDGLQTVKEMVGKAEEMGIEVVAITDHNTVSPLQEMEHVKLQTPIKLLYGLEWTTFYGHVLTIGYKQLQYTDWRCIGPKDIQKGISNIHSHGAIAGIAHPFRIGNPIGTGCHWEFDIEHIDDFDFIEVWNSERPGTLIHNQKAFAFWTDLLNQGYDLPATAGRDWHHNVTEELLLAKTFVQMPTHLSKEKDEYRFVFLESIRRGAMTISYGNPLLLEAQINQKTFTIGDRVSEDGTIHLKAIVEEWHGIENRASVRLYSNLGLLKEEQGVTLVYDCKDKLRWVRAELYADLDKGIELIAFTNPIYFTP